MEDELIRSINLRDLGGVRTLEGTSIRRGVVYRSAGLAGLSGVLLDKVHALGIKTIIDLRHNAERTAYPTPWEALGCTEYWCRDHNDSGADLSTKLRDPALAAAGSRAFMVKLYQTLPYVQASAYTRLFKALAEGQGPVLFHCAVGKDRTGAAAALLLATLGVSHDDIAADYAATAKFDMMAMPHLRGMRSMSMQRLAALAPVLESNPIYLDALFDAVTERSGSVGNYLRDTLKLTESECQKLRENLLTERSWFNYPPGFPDRSQDQ
jgi:protein-tyrosine phosphatase